MATIQVIINDFGEKLSPETPIFIDSTAVAVLRIVVQPYEFMRFAEFCENRYLSLECTHSKELSLKYSFERRGTMLCCDVPVEKLCAGLYQVRLRYTKQPVKAFQLDARHNQSFFVTVNPLISSVGISMCTIYTHMLGPIDEWDKTLGNMIDSGSFNMFHFTPINRFGPSNSCYSLSSWQDWHRTVRSEDKLRAFISNRMNKNGVAAMYDIVLNHVAPTSFLIRATPKNCYNVRDYSYLLPAAILDMNLRVIEASILRNGWDANGTGVFGDETALTAEKLKSFRKSKEATDIHAPGHAKETYYDLQGLLSGHERSVLTLYNLRCCYWEGANGEVGVHHDKASEFCHTLTMFVGNVFDRLKLYEYELLDAEEVVVSFMAVVGRLQESEIQSFIEFCYSTVTREYEKYTSVDTKRCKGTLRLDRIFKAIGVKDKDLHERAVIISCASSLGNSRMDDTISAKSSASTQLKGVSDSETSLTAEEIETKLQMLTITLKNICRCVNDAIYARSHDDRNALLSAVGGGVWYRLFVDVKPAFRALCFSDRPQFDIFMHEFQPILSDENTNMDSTAIIRSLELNPIKTLQEIESTSILCAACNGWVMGATYDFTARESRAYLRYNVITWGDCVKLAYYLPDGFRNKVLWDEAVIYVKRCASIFNSIRIDNAHSTDKHLLQYLISAARSANPNIYVMLECFLGNADADARFLQEVGGNSLVHELVNVTSIGELCSTVVFGGEPIGQVKNDLTLRVPALMFDVTHDNNPPGSEVSYHQRENLLVLASIACSNCRGGMATTFLLGLGYPDKIEVTNPSSYAELCKDGKLNMDYGFGMASARALLSKLHCEFVQNRYSQVYAHCHHDKLMTVERMDPVTGDSYVFVLRPAFKYNYAVWIGVVDIEMLGSYDQPYMYYRPDQTYTRTDDLQPTRLPFAISSEENRFVISFNDSNFPKGSVLIFKKRSAKEYADIISLSAADACFQTFKSNFIRLPTFHQKWFLSQVCEDEDDYVQQGPYVFANDRGYLLPSYSGFDGIRDALYVSDVSGPVAANIRYGDWLVDYICNRNQKYYQQFCRDDMNTDEATREAMSSVLTTLHQYVRMVKRVPTSLRPRCLHHIYALFDEAINTAILVKEGMLSKTAVSVPAPLTDLQTAFCHMYRASLSFIGFEAAHSNVDLKYVNVVMSLLEQMDSFSCSVLGALRDDLYNEDIRANHVSLCAGYPHFFRGMFRSWGRDIALALTGVCTIYKSRQQFARQILLTSFSLLRHGLLPNLQDSGRRPRYNARDAVWFMISALLDYIRYTGDEAILDQAVVRLYPSDKQEDYEIAEGFYVLRDLVSGVETPLCSRYIMTIRELVLEVLSRHYNGIHFREWNAGYQIDEHMRHEGFNIDIVVDKTYGLVSGGNSDNCGTWMDKMGSYDWINRGVPGTSRHGANIEINLCCFGILDYICRKGKSFMPKGKASADQISFEDIERWRDLLATTLEDASGLEATKLSDSTRIIPNGNDALLRTIHRPSKARMLRDTITPDFLEAYKSCSDDKTKMRWRRIDPQNRYFRPNFFIGLSFLKDNQSLLTTLKTEISDGLHELHNGSQERSCVIQARRTLKNAKDELPYGKPREVVPWYMVGMRTVHHLDTAFRMYYDLHDSSSFETAGGLCYHNGPAWSHVYARAVTTAILSDYQEPERLFVNLISFLNNHSNVNNSFKSIPELQQGDGSFCHASCTSQAWSVGGFAEALALLLNRTQ